MKRFIEGAERGQWTLLPECLDDWVSEDNPVRAIDAFVDALDLAGLGFKVQPAETGRPSFQGRFGILMRSSMKRPTHSRT